MKQCHLRLKQSILFEINKHEHCLRSLWQGCFCLSPFVAVLTETAGDAAVSEFSKNTNQPNVIHIFSKKVSPFFFFFYTALEASISVIKKTIIY